jgi:cysteine desulfurase
MGRYYFDWAATAIPDKPPGELAVDLPFGNPSSLHGEGRRAWDSLEQARAQAARVLGLPPATLVFTSGATESNALVLYSLLLRSPAGGIVYSALEHPSITENCDQLERLRIPAVRIPVTEGGTLDIDRVVNVLEKNSQLRMVALMAVNNEVGSIQNVSALSRAIKEKIPHPVHVHCDLVQGIGKIPFAISESLVDSASISAHKIGGPRGIGLLYLKRRIQVLYKGGGQEGGIRSGTENVAGAVALAQALKRHAEPSNVEKEYRSAKKRWETLIQELHALDRCVLIPQDRKPVDPRFSPYILQISLAGIPGEVLLRCLDDEGIAISMGSACSQANQERPLLAEMGIPRETALGAVRFSQGWTTTAEDLEVLVETLKGILKKL